MRDPRFVLDCGKESRGGNYRGLYQAPVVLDITVFLLSPGKP